MPAAKKCYHSRHRAKIVQDQARSMGAKKMVTAKDEAIDATSFKGTFFRLD
jgi:hypothetical protein